ncbi:DUF1254-domain-containing protein [Penicillium hetheringtonii]|uniref:DUF1254-domain-containing protein n=1 Tax=Penicillium hetheringtonii TaxID=911720 RepID=A0AAD6GKV2_9EURO|nr:DUF1254-domain-containing protein [Penicillium hetheringtonii]
MIKIVVPVSVLALTAFSFGAPTQSAHLDSATEFALTVRLYSNFNPTSVHPANCITRIMRYGFFSYPYANSSIEVMQQANGTNNFYHERALATPEFNQVVSPNFDTLYSAAILDLSHNDLIFETPEVYDRYYIFPIYDIYGHIYVNLGSTSKSKAGKYVTPYGSSQPRYGVAGASDDLDKIYAFQNQSQRYTIAKSKDDNADKNEIPRLTKAFLSSSLSSNMALKVMQLTARIAPYNPFRNSSDQARIDRNLKAAGTDNGNVQGDFGTNYPVRHAVATTGYLQLTQSESIYPTYTGESPINLNENQVYLLTSDSKPPLQELGSWSLTAYNAEHFLIANNQNVYSLGDCSNLTYSDGIFIYGNNEHEDTAFQILVQPANVQPPKNWTSKADPFSGWLPATANDGDMSLLLRIYAQEDGLTNGQYKAPLLQKVDAIVT